MLGFGYCGSECAECARAALLALPAKQRHVGGPSSATDVEIVDGDEAEVAGRDDSEAVTRTRRDPIKQNVNIRRIIFVT